MIMSAESYKVRHHHNSMLLFMFSGHDTLFWARRTVAWLEQEDSLEEVAAAQEGDL